MKNYELTITCKGEVKNVMNVSESDVLKMYFNTQEVPVHNSKIEDLKYWSDGIIEKMVVSFDMDYVYSYKQIEKENESLSTEVELNISDLGLDDEIVDDFYQGINDILEDKFGYHCDFGAYIQVYDIEQCTDDEDEDDEDETE